MLDATRLSQLQGLIDEAEANGEDPGFIQNELIPAFTAKHGAPAAAAAAPQETPAKPEQQYPLSPEASTPARYKVYPRTPSGAVTTEEVLSDANKKGQAFEPVKIERSSRVTGAPAKVTGNYGVVEIPKTQTVTTQTFTPEEINQTPGYAEAEQKAKEDAAKRIRRDELPLIPRFVAKQADILTGNVGGIVKSAGERLQQKNDQGFVYPTSAAREKLGAAEAKAGAKVVEKSLKEYPAWARQEDLYEKLDEIKKLDPTYERALKSGDFGVLLDQAVADAALTGDRNYIDQMRAVKDEFKQVYAQQDTEEKKLGVLRYYTGKTVGVLGPMLKSMAMEAPAALIPGAGPLKAARTLAKAAGGAASTLFWMKQSTGDVYERLVDEGVPHEIAIKAAWGGSLPYALAERMQIKAVNNPGARKIIGESFGKYVAKKAAEKTWDLTKESLEETAQQWINDGSAIIAFKEAGMDEKAAAIAAEQLKKGIGAGAEAAITFAPLNLLGLGRAAMRYKPVRAEGENETNIGNDYRAGVGVERETANAATVMEPATTKAGVPGAQTVPPTPPVVAPVATTTELPAATADLNDFGIKDEAQYWSLPENKRDEIWQKLNPAVRDRLENYEEPVKKPQIEEVHAVQQEPTATPTVPQLSTTTPEAANGQEKGMQGPVEAEAQGSAAAPPTQNDFGGINVEALQMDRLTGLPNSSFTKSEAQKTLDTDLTSTLDIDHFKSINDTFGHAEGDKILTQIGAKVNQYFPEYFRGREGGEEFYVNFKNAEISPELKGRLRAFASDIAQTIKAPDGSPVTISIGIARGRRRKQDGSSENRSDHFLYLAKNNGRNQIAIDNGGEIEYNKGEDVSQEYVYTFAKKAIDNYAKLLRDKGKITPAQYAGISENVGGVRGLAQQEEPGRRDLQPAAPTGTTSGNQPATPAPGAATAGAGITAGGGAVVSAGGTAVPGAQGQRRAVSGNDSISKEPEGFSWKKFFEKFPNLSNNPEIQMARNAFLLLDKIVQKFSLPNPNEKTFTYNSQVKKNPWGYDQYQILVGENQGRLDSDITKELSSIAENINASGDMEWLSEIGFQNHNGPFSKENPVTGDDIKVLIQSAPRKISDIKKLAERITRQGKIEEQAVDLDAEAQQLRDRSRELSDKIEQVRLGSSKSTLTKDDVDELAAHAADIRNHREIDKKYTPNEDEALLLSRFPAKGAGKSGKTRDGKQPNKEQPAQAKTPALSLEDEKILNQSQTWTDPAEGPTGKRMSGTRRDHIKYLVRNGYVHPQTGVRGNNTFYKLTKGKGSSATSAEFFHQAEFKYAKNLINSLEDGSPSFQMAAGPMTENTTTETEAQDEARGKLQRLADELNQKTGSDLDVQDFNILVPDDRQQALFKALGTAFPGLRGPYVLKLSPRALRVMDFNGVTISDTIFINSEVNEPVPYVLAHETLHYLRHKNPDSYRELDSFLSSQLTDQGVDESIKRGKFYGSTRKGREEILADALASFIDSPTFWQQAYERSPKMVRDLLAALKDVFDRLIKALYAQKKTDKRFKAEWLKDPIAARQAIARFVSDAAAVERGTMPVGEAFTSAPSFQITAYHGSAYKFNKFEMRPYTGEGAMAFGYGMYFTSSDEIAAYYAKTVGDMRNPVKSNVLRSAIRSIRSSSKELNKKNIADEILDVYNDFKRTYEMSKSQKQYLPGLKSDTEAAFKELKSVDLDKVLTHLYQVTIHKGKTPGEYDYLKWEQKVTPEQWDKIVFQAKKESVDLSKMKDRFAGNIDFEKEPSQWAYKGLSEAFGSDKKASEFLLRAGIDGIDYPAGSMSGYGKADRNYVVFDPEAVTIEERASFMPKNPAQTDLFSAPAEKTSKKERQIDQMDIFGGSKSIEQLEAEERARLQKSEVKKRLEQTRGGEADLAGLGLFAGKDAYNTGEQDLFGGAMFMGKNANQTELDLFGDGTQMNLFDEPSANEPGPSTKTTFEDTETGQTHPVIDAQQVSMFKDEKFVEKTAEKRGIADFGEKIGGARKDIYTEYRDLLTNAEDMDLAAEPLSKTWPEPDYEKLVASGVDPWVVGWVRSMRDEVPTKPQRSYRVDRWVAEVRALRGMASKLLSGDISRERLEKQLANPQFITLKNRLGGRAELYVQIGHNIPLKGVTLQQHYYSIYKGEKNVSKWVVERHARATVMSNMPSELGVGNTKEEAIADFKEKLSRLTPAERKGKPVEFVVYTRRDTKKSYIAKKIGSKRYLELKEFETPKEALDYRRDHQEELEAQLERMKQVPSERREFNRERIGKDHRQGRDVTPEMFQDAFGFRGVEFGNYVNSNERQDNLNRAYDSLVDLASIINVPTKAISLNGELGLAFGARGHGGKNAPAAHYEPGRIVINLTKKSGPGSLAHEWWHAFDNYISRRRGKRDDYVTQTPTARIGDTTRPELLAAFKRVMDAINKTKLLKRSLEQDKTKSEAYWSTPIEMSARVFENYVIDKLKDMGASNDYLANIATSKEYAEALAKMILSGYNRAVEDVYPYLFPDELETVKPEIDNLFGTIKTEETDKGVAMFMPKTADTFYSPTLRAVQGLKQERGTGAQMFAMITKTPGVKEAEWKWMGLDQFLEGRKMVTKQEIEEFVGQNQVKVEEVQKEQNKYVPTTGKRVYVYSDESGNYLLEAGNDDEAESIVVDVIGMDSFTDEEGNQITYKAAKEQISDNLQEVEDVNEFKENNSVSGYWGDINKFKKDSTKYGPNQMNNMVLPGGENYREVLLTLPPKTGERFKIVENDGVFDVVDTETGNIMSSSQSMEKAEERLKGWAGEFDKQPTFKHSHWSEPNVIAHIRLDDRSGPNGEKVLFVEEIQSDWAREARERGVGNATEKDFEVKEIQPNVPAGKNPDNYEPYWRVYHKPSGVWYGPAASSGEDALKKAIDIHNKRGVPEQPFLKNWEELALKRILRLAAEEGYDRVAWINGEQTAARYDLSKQVKYVAWEKNDDGTFNINAPLPDGTPGIYKEDLSIKEVGELVGKDLAGKIAEGQGTPITENGGYRDWVKLEGENLKIGGEWASNLYDRMIPKFYEKYGKKWGVKVEEVPIDISGMSADDVGAGKKAVVQKIDGRWAVRFDDGEVEDFYDDKASAQSVADRHNDAVFNKESQQQSIAITSEMRETVMDEGQPMFMGKDFESPSGLSAAEREEYLKQRAENARHDAEKADKHSAELTTAINKLRYKLTHLPIDKLSERAEIELQIAGLADERTDTAKRAIYSYARGLGLNGIPYNQVDTLLKNAKTRADIRKAVERLDVIWERATKRAAVERLYDIVERKYKRLQAIRQGKVKSTLSAEANDRLGRYLDRLIKSPEENRDAINKMLAAFNYYGKKEARSAESLADMHEDVKSWISDPTTDVPQNIKNAIKQLFAPAIESMSTEEMQRAVADIESIEQYGRSVKEVQDEEAKAEIDQASAAIARQIAESTKDKKQSDLDKMLESKAKTKFAYFADLVGKSFWDLIDPERMVEWLVGWKKTGLIKEKILAPIYSAENRKIRGVEKALEKFKGVHAAINMADAIKNTGMNLSVELLDAEGKTTGTKDYPLTLDNMMFVYANSRNEGNLSHLLGTGLTQEHVDAIIAALPKEYRDAVDSMIGYFDNEQYPRMNEVFRAEHDVDMPRITGYFPIQNVKTDKAESAVVADFLARSGSRFGSVQKGMTKSRVLSRAPFRDASYFNAVVRNLTQTEHYIAYNEAVRTVGRYLRNKDMRDAIETRAPQVYRHLTEWLKAVAYGRVNGSENTLDKVADYLRKNFATYVLGFKLTTGMQQLSSFAKGAAMVDKKVLMRAVAAFSKNPPAFIKSVDEKSAAMAARQKSYERELAEMAETSMVQAATGTQGVITKVRDAAMWHIGATDKAVASVLWGAKYEEQIRAGATEQSAIDSADEVIRKTQSRGGGVTTPAIYRGGGIVRAYTMFTSDLNQNFNILFEMVGKWGQQPTARNIAQAFWYFALPTMMIYIINNAFKPDRPEEAAKTLVNQFAGGIPFWGQLIDALMAAGADEVKELRGLIPSRTWKMFADDITPTSLTPLVSAIKAAANLNPVAGFDAFMQFSGIPWNATKRALKGGKTAWETKDARYLIWSPEVLKEESVFNSMAKRALKPRPKSNDKQVYATWYRSIGPDKKAAFREYLKDFATKKAEEELKNKIEKVSKPKQP